MIDRRHDLTMLAAIGMLSASMRRRRPPVEKRIIPKEAPAMPKAGRNEPCPCGSGKKFKRCCLGN